MKKVILFCSLLLAVASCKKDSQCFCTATPGICTTCTTQPVSSSYSPETFHDTEKKSKAACEAYNGTHPAESGGSTLTDCHLE